MPCLKFWMLVKAVLIKSMRAGRMQMMVRVAPREYQARKKFPNRAAGLLKTRLKSVVDTLTFMKSI